MASFSNQLSLYSVCTGFGVGVDINLPEGLHELYVIASSILLILTFIVNLSAVIELLLEGSPQLTQFLASITSANNNTKICYLI